MKEAYKRSCEAVILAGGKGNRMGEISRDRQKCLLPIDGKPALVHIIDNLTEAFGSVDVKISVAYKAEQVKEEVERYKNGKKVSITYVPHQQGSESVSAYKTVIPYINGGNIIVSPGDVIAKPEAYYSVLKLFEDKKTSFTLCFSPDINQVDSHSIGKIENGYLVKHYFPPISPVPEGYMRELTIYGSDRHFFDIVTQYGTEGKTFLYAISQISETTKLAAFIYQDKWVHIGYPEDLKKTMG